MLPIVDIISSTQIVPQNSQRHCRTVLKIQRTRHYQLSHRYRTRVWCGGCSSRAERYAPSHRPQAPPTKCNHRCLMHDAQARTQGSRGGRRLCRPRRRIRDQHKGRERAWAAAASRGPTDFRVTPEQKAPYTREGIVAAAAALVDTVRRLGPLVHQVHLTEMPPSPPPFYTRTSCKPSADTERALYHEQRRQDAICTMSRSRWADRPSWPRQKQNKPTLRACPAACSSISGPWTRSMGCLPRGCHANQNSKLVVFDPVGVGATAWRSVGPPLPVSVFASNVEWSKESLR